MNLLPFDALPAHKPRRFVPQEIDLGDWDQIAPLFDQLEARAPACASAADLERWLLDWSELSAALDEESSKRYIAMTCHTDNAEAEKAYLHFVENVEPQLKPRQFKLAQTYVAHPLRAQLPQAALPGVRPRHPGPGRAVPAGECAAGNRGGQAEPAIPEAQRLAHRAVPRRREDAGADGPLPRRARPRAAPGSVGTGRQPPLAGSGEVRGDLRPARQAARSRSRRTPASATTAIMPSASWAGSTTRRPTAWQFHEAVEQEIMPVRARTPGRAQAAARRRARCGPGTWRWTR